MRGIAWRLLLAAGVLCAVEAAATAQSPPERGPGPVHAEMRNVTFRFTPDVSALVLWLDGELRPRPGWDAVVFERKNSFDLVIHTLGRASRPPDRR